MSINIQRYVVLVLLLQALQEGKAMWNRTNAVDWLLNHQGPDGAFFDIATTAEVIIALARVSGVAEGIADHCEVRPGAGECFGYTAACKTATTKLRHVHGSPRFFEKYSRLVIG